MPYITANDRPLLVALIRELKIYPSWEHPEGNATILAMIYEWLKFRAKDQPLKIDGYVNYLCTVLLKHTHRTYCMKGGKQVWNSLDKEVARTIHLLLAMAFEQPMPSYSSYERLYGLISLMEAEFERRGWSLGRPDIKAFFITEIKRWRKTIAEYEDKKIKENGDV
jgi:hypothetical protein